LWSFAGVPRSARPGASAAALPVCSLVDWRVVILENGVIRTLDPQLPTARALAIAGAYVAGGVVERE
jgi:hypothetical protein